MYSEAKDFVGTARGDLSPRYTWILRIGRGATVLGGRRFHLIGGYISSRPKSLELLRMEDPLLRGGRSAVVRMQGIRSNLGAHGVLALSDCVGSSQGNFTRNRAPTASEYEPNVSSKMKTCDPSIYIFNVVQYLGEVSHVVEISLTYVSHSWGTNLKRFVPVALISWAQS